MAQKKKIAKKKAARKKAANKKAGPRRQNVADPWRRIDFEMLEQEQTKWCWAAVGASVALYYEPHSPWTQCRVANGQLERNDCCGNGAAGPCNRYSFLGSVLDLVECLDSWDVGNSATFQEVRTEIDRERPLCFRVVWNGGGAHFATIVGYLLNGGPAGRMIAIEDPFWGPTKIPFDNFPADYQIHGNWADTYYTTH